MTPTSRRLPATPLLLFPRGGRGRAGSRRGALTWRSAPRAALRWPAVAALALALAAAPAPAGAEPPEPGTTVEVAGVEVPVHGSFHVRYGRDSRKELVLGLVHGVRRIDGGTVVYLSLGRSPEASGPLSLAGLIERSRHYHTDAMSDLQIVDRPSKTAYVPLRGGDAEPYTTSTGELRSLKPGELTVIWAAFPELPADVDQVDVVFGTSNAMVSGVPVEDGPLEPVVDENAPLVGQGWPQVPSADELAGADTAWSTRDLVLHQASVDESTSVAETAETVDASLAADVLFDKGSAALTPASQDALARLAADIKARGTGEVRVVGHTDSDGSDASNQTLSEQRAAAVVAALQPAAGGAVTFVAEGRGESEPVAPNDSPENMQLNRRVTVTYQLKEGAR